MQICMKFCMHFCRRDFKCRERISTTRIEAHRIHSVSLLIPDLFPIPLVIAQVGVQISNDFCAIRDFFLTANER
jgi:hypothetical protein